MLSWFTTLPVGVGVRCEMAEVSIFGVFYFFTSSSIEIEIRDGVANVSRAAARKANAFLINTKTRHLRSARQL